jgi:ABC-type transport system involved in multi-copper enzyme maturation permease subunit
MDINLIRVFSHSLQLMLRQKLLPLAAFAFAAVLIASALAAEFGGRQPATVALDVGLSTLRLVLPLFMVFQVQELFSREFERKFYQVSLTYPVSRISWLLGRFLALLGASVALLLLIAIVLSIQVSVIGQGYAQPTPVGLGLPYWTTIAFIGLDMLVLICLACFLAVIAVTPSFVLIGTLGFMLIARSYSAVLMLLTSDVKVVEHQEAYRTNLGVLGYLLPDLGALDVRMTTLYGQMQFLPDDWPLLGISALLYALGFLGLSLWLFNRKQFA